VLTANVAKMLWWMMQYGGDNLVITENSLGLSKSTIQRLPSQQDVKDRISHPGV
jgi:hypothetical protein